MNKRFLLLTIISTVFLSACQFDLSNLGINTGNDVGDVNVDDSLWDSSQDSLRKGTKQLDFYNLNDFHGAVEFDSEASEPGINKLSTYIKNQKAKNEKGFVLTSSGDMWQGSADSNITRGRLVTDWMNHLSFDAMAVGNHEFDWTIDVINENQKLMNFPLLACNIVSTSTYQPVDWVKPYTTITKNGVRIGIIGAIGEGITRDIISSNVEGLSFMDPTIYVTEHAKTLREKGADIVMLLLHDSIYKVSTKTADSIDLVFGGHNHQGETDTLGSKNIPGVEAWSNGKDIGHISLQYDFSSKKVTSSSGEILQTTANYLSSYKDDPETKAIYDRYLEEEISVVKNRVVGYTSSGISKYNIPAYYNKYAYAYFKEHQDSKNEYPIFAVETNAARSAIGVGDITYGDVYKALPFDNFLCLVEISKANIRNYLSTYSAARFYLPDSDDHVDGSAIRNYASGEGKVYMLIINYIATFTDYNNKLTIVHEYSEEGALPRNIFAEYVHTNFPIR